MSDIDLRKALTRCAEDYDELFDRFERLREALEEIQDMPVEGSGCPACDMRAVAMSALQEAGDE
jgi:hypothetical protein